MIKNVLKFLFKRLGYTISKTPKPLAKVPPKPVENVFTDIQKLLTNQVHPVIFDIGANVGQTITEFKKYLPGSIIHSFEPGTDSFLQLSEKFGNKEDIFLSHTAVGSENTSKEFLENERSNMSSFFELGPLGWGALKNKTMVTVQTVDFYCQQNDIDAIDVLKSDTQGFELEVFRGALSMMPNIKLIYFEIIFSEMYKQLPTFGDIYNLLTEHNFQIFKFYDFYYQEDRLSWGDVLFIKKS